MADNLGLGGNPYLQNLIDQSQADLVRGYDLSTAPSIASAMVRSGSFGNSGLQQMQQEAASQLQKNLGNLAGSMRANDYWTAQNFNRGVYNDTFNQQQQQFNNGLSMLGLANQGATQNLGLGTQIQNTPLNYYGQFADQANAFGQGYGTTTGTSSARGSPVMGALGGWQLGGQIAKGWGGGGGYDSWQTTGNGMPSWYTLS